MRLTSWNLLHGLEIPSAQMTNPGQNPALLALSVGNLGSDILGVQEVDFYLERSGNQNQVGEIAALLGASHWAFAPSVIGSPDEKWRGTSSADQKVVTEDVNLTSDLATPGYGIGLISKLAVKSWHRLDLKAAPIGLLMALPVDGKLKRIYVRDHPRSALAAVLENGWLVVNTHLSFVPIFNIFQLLKIKRWVKKLPVKNKYKIILMGDLNLPFGFLVKGFNWNSLARQKTFPSWGPRLQIDFILSQKVASEDVSHSDSIHCGISDHLPLSIDIETS